ncbi:unnamed protein product [Sphagnum jensenii]|uniref:DUF4378 domain-containing protein n=1 Tax=Sphagnum jensenii TaxID=128206 RepID=A0ABP0VPY8_9BRYO
MMAAAAAAEGRSSASSASTPPPSNFHTGMQSPARVVGGSCVSAFFHLFEWNPSKRFSLASRRHHLPPDFPGAVVGDNFSKRSLKQLEDCQATAPGSSASSQFLQADEEDRRRACPMSGQNFSTPASAADFHSTSSSPMVLGKKRVPGVVARLMGLESLPNAAAGIIMSHHDPRSSCAAELMDIDSAAADNRSSVITSSCFEENVPLGYEQSESPAMLQELLLCNLDDETDDTGRSCSKLVGLVAGEGVKEPGKKVQVGHDAGQKSQLWSSQQEKEEESILAPQARDGHGSEASSDIVQEESLNLLLLEKKDEKLQSSIVKLPPNHCSSSSSSSSLLHHDQYSSPSTTSLPAAASKSHNQMSSSLLLRSSSTKKLGTAVASCLLDQTAVTVKILEPYMQHPSRTSSHDRQQQLTAPSTPSLPDFHSRNAGTLSQGQHRIVVASEKTVRKLRSRGSGFSSSSAFTNLQSGGSKEHRGLSRSRTSCNGLRGYSEEETVMMISSAAQIDAASPLNRGSVSFRESSCRYKCEEDHMQNADSNSTVAPRLGNHACSLSTPPCLNARQSKKKAVDLKSSCNSLDMKGSTTKSCKTDEAASSSSSMEKLKSKLMTAALPSTSLSAMASSSSERFAKASSTSGTHPDYNQKMYEGSKSRTHQAARRSLSFSFGDIPENIVTEFPDFKEVPEPLSPQLPVPSVPAISQNQLLSSGSPVLSSSTNYGEYETLEPFVSPLVSNSIVLAAKSCDLLPSSPQSTSMSSKKWRSHGEVNRAMNPQQQQQQPSPTTSLLPVVPPAAAIEVVFSPTTPVLGNGKPVLPPQQLLPFDGRRSISALHHGPMMVAKPDKEVIFPKQHRLSTVCKPQGVDLLHGGGGPQAHQIDVPACLSLEEVPLEEEKEHAFSSRPAGMMTVASNSKKLFSIRRNGNSSRATEAVAAAGKQAMVMPKGAETTVRSVLLHPQSVPHTKCPAKAIVDAVVSRDPTTLRMKSSAREIQQSNNISEQLIGMTRDQRVAAATAEVATTAAGIHRTTTQPVELKRGFFAERAINSRNTAKVRELIDDAAAVSLKLENKRPIEGGSSIPSHSRARSVDEVFPELPLDSDLTATNLKIAEKRQLSNASAQNYRAPETPPDHRSCEHKKRSLVMSLPLGDKSPVMLLSDERGAADDGARIRAFPDDPYNATPLFSKGFGDPHSEDEIKHWRRSLVLMGLISESHQACNKISDLTHDFSVIRDTLWAETNGAWSSTNIAAAAQHSVDGGAPETPEQAVSSSTPPPGACEDEEQEEGLTPILRKWFSERSSNSGGAMGIEQQGEQPSPVSILDSPFHDEVSTTPEASLTESEHQLDEVLELHKTCAGVVIRAPSSLQQSDKVDAEKASNEEHTCRGGSGDFTAGVSSAGTSREKEKIRQAMMEISKFQNAKLLHGRRFLVRGLPPAIVGPEEEQSFIHGILKAAKLLSENVESNNKLKWFAPGLPMDPSLFDRLESGDSEQINLADTAATNLAQTKSSSCLCGGGVLWRCNRKLLFDSMNEALVAEEDGFDGELNPSLWVKSNDKKVVISASTLAPGGRCKLVDQLYGTIHKWRELASSDVDSLIDRDMNCGIGKWRYYDQEIRDFSLEIGGMLLGMMIEEVVIDLAAASVQLESVPKDYSMSLRLVMT